MAKISNKSLYVNNHSFYRCCKTNLKAQRVLLIATLLFVLAISIKALTRLKALIKSTSLNKLPPDQSNTRISNIPKSSSKKNLAALKVGL